MRQAPSRRALFLSVGGYTWTGTTWALTGGRAYNTPTLGSELVSDGGFENWLSAPNLTSWTESLAGASTVNQESSGVHGGTYAARFDIDASNSAASITQAGVVSIGMWIYADWWAKTSASGKTLRMSTGATSFILRDPGITWTRYVDTFRAIAAGDANIVPGYRGSAASASLYIDDVSIKAISLPTAFSSVVGVAGQTVTAKPYAIATGTQAGVISHLDSAASPANFIIAYHDGGTSIKMDKCVGGTYSNLVSATVAFASDAVIEIRSVGSNQFECWYNGSKRGLTATVSDAGIISNTRYGLFSTYSANQFSDGLTLGGVLIPFKF
jgi:hypothetical protein